MVSMPASPEELLDEASWLDRAGREAEAIPRCRGKSTPA
jgi:hypothetical protein